MGGDLIAIGPARIRVQIKRDDPAFVAEFPALGHAGLGFECDRVFDREAFKQRANNVVFGYAGDHMGIETLRLRTIAVVQHTVAVPRDHIALATAAGGDQRQPEGGEDPVQARKAHSGVPQKPPSAIDIR